MCSPCTFLRFGVAHIFLLGILRDFWKQWLPGPGAKRTGAAARYVLPVAIRRKITYRGVQVGVRKIALMKNTYRDIVQYALPGLRFVFR